MSIPAAAPDLRFDTAEWATDLGRVIEQATRPARAMHREQLVRVATILLNGFSSGGVTEGWRLRSEVLAGAPVAPGRFNVDYWAADLSEAVLVASDGYFRLTGQEALTAADLLLHGQEAEWVPQAARLRSATRLAAPFGPAPHVLRV